MRLPLCLLLLSALVTGAWGQPNTQSAEETVTDHLSLSEKLSPSDGLLLWQPVLKHLEYINDLHFGGRDAAAWKNYYRRRPRPPI